MTDLSHMTLSEVDSVSMFQSYPSAASLDDFRAVWDLILS